VREKKKKFYPQIQGVTTVELPPLPEPYNSLVNPVMKEALDIMSVVNSIIDEVVDKLLNEAAEKYLRKIELYCNNTV
jgi:hypothetical protein